MCLFDEDVYIVEIADVQHGADVDMDCKDYVRH